MTTDLEIDHGMDHADHMGTETLRRAEVARIEAVLAAPQPIAELA